MVGSISSLDSSVPPYGGSCRAAMATGTGLSTQPLQRLSLNVPREGTEVTLLVLKGRSGLVVKSLLRAGDPISLKTHRVSGPNDAKSDCVSNAPPAGVVRTFLRAVVQPQVTSLSFDRVQSCVSVPK
ncbi:hypothetical protein AVEN_62998-1 [Araneus ventricosus]|uniref:Uncharacterized protein n=1 Tax=Araneus ventricosus TaxID=182803 RepID=A0A4Y2CSA5_ARAVE|nr:hypothetical protein AVEN_62998-1 [Araneus ventricosus]